MALRSGKKFILNRNYRSHSFLSLLRSKNGGRALPGAKSLHGYENFALQTERTACAQIIMECYQRRDQHFYMKDEKKNESTSLQEVESEKTLYRVVLTARPDEFEKLPPKCSACGTILQTKQSDAIGFINEIKFLESLQNNSLDKLICYNCFQLRYHNTSVLPRISNVEAMDQLRHLRQRKALILYVVDMFDIEGTTLRNILQLIGKNKRLLIVGNKIDRLPQDYKKPAEQLEAMKDVLKDICFKNGLEHCNFKDICLVSARTGFGLKSLVEKIVKHREGYMDVYLVGCANTGKSTLYNILVNLLNVHKSSNLPSQAIVHHTPGSTSSLVRQSISQGRLNRLIKRLTTGPWEEEEPFDFDDELLHLVGVKDDDPRYEPMGKTSKKSIYKGRRKLLEEREDMLKVRPLEFVDEMDEKNEKKPCFIYDTPGILNNSQIVNYLTPSEINYLSPTRWVIPRTVILTPGKCIFVGGLARLDYLSIKRSTLDIEEDETDGNDSSEDMHKAASSIYVTAMVSPNVPIHVTMSETADEKFEKLFSDNFFQIPEGSAGRFDDFPRLLPSQYTIIGKSRNLNACDFVLHGVGWLSIAAVSDAVLNFALHTPNGEGQGLRLNPLLPYTVQKKFGRGVSYRGRINRHMYGHSRKRSPQFIRVFQQQNDTVHSWHVKIKQKMRQERIEKKELKRLERLEQGIVLGRMRKLKEKEERFRVADDQNYLKLLEKGEE